VDYLTLGEFSALAKYQNDYVAAMQHSMKGR